MDHEQMVRLIEQQGPQKVGAMIHNPIHVGFDAGINVTDWQVQVISGAAMFVRFPKGAHDVPPESAILCVNANQTNRAEYDEMAAGAGYPVTVLMTPQAPF